MSLAERELSLRMLIAWLTLHCNFLLLPSLDKPYLAKAAMGNVVLISV